MIKRTLGSIEKLRLYMYFALNLHTTNEKCLQRSPPKVFRAFSRLLILLINHFIDFCIMHYKDKLCEVNIDFHIVK